MIYDIIIIGGGIAGLTSAIYSIRAGKKVAIFEAEFIGGAIVTSPIVENYPAIKEISGVDLANELLSQIENTNVDILYENILSVELLDDIKIIKSNKSEYKTKTVIIATGTKRKNLGIKDENKFIGRGISYCAYCDGSFFTNKIVAIVGGGNTAIEDCIYLSNICKKVYLIHRRDKFRADSILVESMKNIENISFIYDSIVQNINGEQFLDSITIKNIKTNNEKLLEIDGLFIAIGQIPQNQIFSPPVNIDKYGYIIASEDCKTNISGVYVAGDCRTKLLRQLITASADGATAVASAIEYINGGK